MKAITIHQPWAQLIAEGYKTIETRRHDRFRGLIGQTIAIHAGKQFDPSAIAKAWRFLSPRQRKPLESALAWPEGCIVALAHVNSHVLRGECSTNPYRHPATFDAAALCHGDYSTWGYVLTNVRKLASPVPCRGFQGAWTVPGDVLAKIEAQL